MCHNFNKKRHIARQCRILRGTEHVHSERKNDHNQNPSTRGPALVGGNPGHIERNSRSGIRAEREEQAGNTNGQGRPAPVTFNVVKHTRPSRGEAPA